MLEIKNKQQCTGCGACYNICPKQAISMKEDEEGFKYPVIDKEKCVNCKLCDKICPVLNEIKTKNKEINVVAAYTKSEEEREKSSSGGIFFELAEIILSKNGVVVGAGYDSEFNVIHKVIYDKKDLAELQGSKYVQSDTNDTYRTTKNLLEEDKSVLFVGTPCQIAGLKAFLGKEYDKLYTVDLVCHGVPSPKLWRKYLSEYNKEIKNCYFRNKDNGWNNFSMKIVYSDNKYKRSMKNKDNYLKIFLNNYSLRPSCYNCKFSKLPRTADISLGDFWGIENIYQEFNDDKGTSLILINNEKGEKLYNQIKYKLKYREKCDLNYAIKCNPCICASVKEPIKRTEFF